jgi:hypothetical protein
MHHNQESKIKMSLAKIGKTSWNKGKKSPWTTKRNLKNNPAKNPLVKDKLRKIAIKRNVAIILKLWLTMLWVRCSMCVGAVRKKQIRMGIRYEH